ncbi:MAG: PKD domain-containing protein, partial [Planctomycetales bacterium]|nr:PKD domain-containing protein [Planctomycetales bacterium]
MESGGRIFFTADDTIRGARDVNSGFQGNELYVIEGTNAPRLVKDIRPGYYGSAPLNLIDVGGVLFFSADDGEHGRELWKSDGTAAGTVPLGAFEPDEIANVGGALFFQAAEFENSIKQQLWTSDGTPEGTRLVKYIENSNGDSISSQEFVDIGGTTYFVAESSDFGQELWKSDGTESGTAMVRDIRPNQGSSSIRSLSNIDGTLYFIANDGTGFELWASDGTEAGTTAVTNFVATNVGFGELVVQDDTLFFVVLDATSGSELWTSDGTTAGTTRVKDIYPGSTGSSPQHLTVVGDRVYFSARDNSFGFELWSSDGTSAGTVRIKDIATGSASSSPSNLIAVGDHLFFEAADATSGRELWFSDGSTAGTYRIQDLTPGTGSSNLTLMTSLGDVLYFTDRQSLWTSNGTAQGTSAILPFSNSQDQLLRWEEYNGQLYFLMNTGIFNYELWKSDGTTSGTVPIRTFTRPESGLDYELAQMQVIGDHLYFSMFDSLNGLELWITDGTAENTRLAQDLSIGSSRPLYFTESNGRIFFAATSDQAGFEPWIGGFAPVADIVTNEIVFEGDAVVLASRSASQSEIVTVEWDLDYDGTVFDVDATGNLSSFLATEGPSTQTVALRVTNEIGFSDVTTKTISILNAPPVITGLSDVSTILPGLVTLSATVTDAGVDDTVSLRWNLGDGTIRENLLEVTHTYQAEGQYFASLTATDSDGAVTVKNFRVVVGPPVTVTASASELAEGDSVTLTASLDSVLSEDVVIPLTYSGAALADTDFAEVGETSAPISLTIPAEQLSASVVIISRDDSLDEHLEEMIVHVGVPANASLASPDPIVVSLLDNDSEPTVYISSDPQLLDESVGSVPLVVSLSEPSGRDVVVRLEASGSATNGSDFTLSDSLLVIPAGETAVETTLSIVDDNLGENAEQIIVAISTAQNAAVIDSETYPADILHVLGANDAPTIEFLSTFKRVSETVGAYSIDVVLSNPSQDDITFDYSVLGSAVTGADFDVLSTSPTLTIAAGDLSHEINFQIIDNASQDSYRYFTTRLLSATNAILGPTRYRTTQIVDDESLEIRLSASTKSIWEDEAFFTVTASLNSPAPSAFIVPFELSGIATEGTHYFASNTYFEFGEGDQSALVTFVLAPDDSVRESNRTMKLTLQEPVEASLRDSAIEVTIKDNDPWVATTPFRYGLYPVYDRNAARSSINESDGEETFTVYLSQPSNHDIVVPLEYTLLTAENNDLSRAVSSITIPAGKTSSKAEIAIIDDTRDEAAESFRVAIGEPSGANKYSDAPTYSQRTVTIYDNDAPPNPYWVFPESIIREGDTPVVAVGIRLAGTSDTLVTARIITGGTATRGQDYELDSDQITFLPTQREKVVLVGIGDDGDYEALETIDLHVDTGGGRISTFTINLNDNDSQPRSNEDNRPWWEKLGDEIQKAGNGISDGLKSIRDGVVNLPNDICAVVLNPFEPNRPLNSCGIAHDGYFDNGTIFVDYNFNETVDFVDVNNDGVASEGDLIEVTTNSEYNGEFTATVLPQADRNNNGRVDETEAQLVSYGGTDVSTGFDSRIPLTAPLGYPVISPLTTLVAKQRLETGESIEVVEQQIADALSLPSINYLAADLIAVANQDDLFAASAFAKSVQLFSTVQQVASFVSNLPNGPSVRLAGSLAFADIASKLRESDAILDLTETFLIESVLQGTLIRAGMNEVSTQVASDVANIVTASNQAISAATGASGREWLEAVVQVQGVSTSSVAQGLGQLASGHTTAADLNNQFTGIGLHGLIEAQVIGNVVAPYIVADDVTIVEGDDGTTLAVFNVALTDPSNLPVSVQFTTSDFTASAGEDYVTTSGQLTWQPGETTVHTVAVPIIGDTFAEADERFYLILTDAVNAQVLETIAFGDIVSDDAVTISVGDNSIDHILTLNVSEDGTRLFDNGEVAFEGVTSGEGAFVIEAVDGVQTDLFATILPDSLTPTEGFRFIGSGVSSSLTIDASNASSIEHIQIDDLNGWFVIDGVVLRYEDVGSINSPVSPTLSGLPGGDLAFGDSITLVGELPGSFDPLLLTTETWTIYLDEVELTSIDGNSVSLTVSEVGTYRLTYTASQEGRIPAVGSFEFAVTNAPPIAVDDSFTADEDVEMLESAGSGLLANDSDSTAGPIVVSAVEGRSILADQPFEFASATLDASIPYLATSIDDANYYGVRFEVTEAVEINRVGGNFQFITGTGPFAAIVRLDGPSDFPDSENLS